MVHKRFQIPGPHFNLQAMFTINEQVNYMLSSKPKTHSLLEETFSPQCLNVSLNYPQGNTRSIW